MNTTFLLMAEYETAAIPLSAIAEKYLGLKPATAESKARTADLPFPTFRVGESQKSPRLVHIEDLAHYIDKARQDARKEFNHCQ